MKTFYAAEDIEALAEKGQFEIFVDKNTVLTDMAVHAAQMLGIRITENVTRPGQTAPPRGPAPTGATAQPPSPRPKACQIRPAESSGQVAAPAARLRQPIVDQLVDAVKRMNSN